MLALGELVDRIFFFRTTSLSNAAHGDMEKQVSAEQSPMAIQ
jgi:hypothetical protein